MAELQRVGDEIVVTPPTRTGTPPNDGLLPATAILSNGKIVVTFVSEGDIWARIFDGAGMPLTNPFVVNTITSGSQHNPEILALADGTFLIAYQSASGASGDPSSNAILTQKFDHLGSKIGGEMLVNTLTEGSQAIPEMLALTNGGYVIHWYAPDGVKAQVFNSSGAKVGGEIAIDSPFSEITFPLALPGGGFVFTHVEKVEGRQDFLWFVVGQKYDSAGQPVGSEYIIQGLPGTNQQVPPFHVHDAANLSSGGAVIALYADSSNPTGTGEVYGVRVDENMVGTGLFLVNNNTAGQQSQPQVIAVAGGFFFAWTDQSAQYDPSGSGIVGQLYDNLGNEVGSEFRVNTRTDLTQQNPELAGQPNRIIAVWQDQDAPGSFTHDVRLQIFGSPLATRGILGTEGNDAFTDFTTVNEPQEYPEQFFGYGGDDTLTYRTPAEMTNDRFEGGAGSDRVILRGQFGGGATFDTNMLSFVETVELVSSRDPRFTREADYYAYNLTMRAGNVAPGGTLTIDGSALAYGESFYFYGTEETAGRFTVLGGGSNDVVLAGQAGDTIRGGLGGDYLSGWGGNDSFLYGSIAELLGDQVDGGAGSDTMTLNGQMASGIFLAPGAIQNVETILLVSAPAGSYNGYNLTLTGGTLAAGQALLVDGTALRGGEGLYFDATAETQGSFDLRGGGAFDYLFGGSGNDSLRGGLSGDWLQGGGGADTFIYASVAESTGRGHDFLVGFDYRVDRIDLPSAPPSWSGDVTGGALRTASFDSDLAAAVDGALQSNSGVLFRPSSGEYAGHLIAVIDVNGDGNYQAGQDYVLDFYSPAVPIPSAPAIFV
ncbi:MAG TPA: calcium-binding protein [Allosphingosinicella sp.]